MIQNSVKYIHVAMGHLHCKEGAGAFQPWGKATRRLAGQSRHGRMDDGQSTRGMRAVPKAKADIHSATNATTQRATETDPVPGKPPLKGTCKQFSTEESIRPTMA